MIHLYPQIRVRVKRSGVVLVEPPKSILKNEPIKAIGKDDYVHALCLDAMLIVHQATTIGALYIETAQMVYARHYIERCKKVMTHAQFIALSKKATTRKQLICEHVFTPWEYIEYSDQEKMLNAFRKDPSYDYRPWLKQLLTDLKNGKETNS